MAIFKKIKVIVTNKGDEPHQSVERFKIAVHSGDLCAKKSCSLYKSSNPNLIILHSKKLGGKRNIKELLGWLFLLSQSINDDFIVFIKGPIPDQNKEEYRPKNSNILIEF
ncbi:hypothetical protein ACFL08_01570 [Patescibacteria group bacterium]